MHMINGSWIFGSVLGLLGLTMVSALGCSSSSSPTEKYCQDQASGLCHKAYSCTPAAMQDAAFHDQWGPSETMCAAGLSQLCAQGCAGKQVDQAAQTQCFSTLNAATCAAVADGTIDAACQNVCVDAPITGTGGNNGGGVGGSSGSAADALAFCRASNNSICDRAFQCVPVASQDADFTSNYGATVAACKAMTTTTCVDPATNCPTYNATAGNSCLAALVSSPCTDLLFLGNAIFPPASCFSACGQ
jgi:hypothetical protein